MIQSSLKFVLSQACLISTVSRTLARRPDLDPKDLYSYMLPISEKRAFVQRADVGTTDEDGKLVPPEKLCNVFRPGVIVQVDVSLRQYVLV